MKRSLPTLILALAVACVSFAKGRPENDYPFERYSNESIIRWNSIAQETMQGPAYNPLLASRIMAMVHVAMHDAVNNIIPVYDTYALKAEDKKAHPVAALSAAAHRVLLVSFPDKKSDLDAALKAILESVKEGSSKDRGVALGVKAADAILELRKNDGAFADPIARVNNPATPGMYQAVPPMTILYAPFWTTMKPFALESPSQFRVGAMPDLTSQEYTNAFNEVKLKGVKENSTRSAEETYIAQFWYEFSEIGWNRVTATVVRDANTSLLATARLFALVNIALADSYTAGWDSKFHHNFWRPYTAIRAAATDGNAQTKADEAWEPFMVTPPVHDYPSTHSVLGSSAATVLAAILGDNTTFTMTSTSAEPANSTRTFTSFSKAAHENGDSRVYAGIHFRFSCDSGLKQGKEIGDWVVRHYLKPKNSKGL